MKRDIAHAIAFRLLYLVLGALLMLGALYLGAREQPSQSTPPIAPCETAHYIQQTGLHAIYPTLPGQIVMLGDSITQPVDWRALLNRDNVVNRGIRGDTAACALQRIDEITALKPATVCIMLGINDVVRGVPVAEIADNYYRIIDALATTGSRVIVQSTLRVGPTYPNAETVNAGVDALNAALADYAHSHDLIFLDLNVVITPDMLSFDGVHPDVAAYAEWRDALAPLLP